MDNKTIGKFIATRRAQLGLTQSALAEQLHITDKAVSRWERGLGLPDVGNLPALAEALGVSVDELLSPPTLRSNTHRCMRMMAIITLAAVGVLAYLNLLFYKPPITDPRFLLMRATQIQVKGEDGVETVSFSQNVEDELAQRLHCNKGQWRVEQYPPYEGWMIYEVGKHKFYFDMDGEPTLIFVRLPDAERISGQEFFDEYS
ncbi:MAG: helix-turn-helix transcriptional regulator [Clostridia bacterium]|nr:helix-turn-helix transcriptional regulator [Clostridia bacterium]